MISKALIKRVIRINELAMQFCQKKLNKKFEREIERLITFISKQNPSPFVKSQEHIWAAAIIKIVSNSNQLFSKTSSINCLMTDIYKFYKTNSSTVVSREKEIEALLAKNSENKQVQMIWQKRLGNYQDQPATEKIQYILRKFCYKKYTKEYLELLFNVLDRFNEIEPDLIDNEQPNLIAASIVHAVNSIYILKGKTKPYLTIKKLSKFFEAESSAVKVYSNHILTKIKTDVLTIPNIMTKEITKINSFNNIVLINGEPKSLSNLPAVLQNRINESRKRGKNIKIVVE